ncbi:MAG: hypothetical protein K6U88_06705 [Dehalococcoidia bacterium]|nr:hypothetical protein [Dehalococcoidia bacterium]
MEGQGVREPQGGDQCLRQFERDAGAAQHVETRGVLRPLGVENGLGRRKNRTGEVVVGDDRSVDERAVRRQRHSQALRGTVCRNLEDIRPWLFTWGELGLIQICGKNAASVQAVIEACRAIPNHPGVIRLQDFVINTDVIVLSTPEIAGLPYVISGLVAAGGLAAALSTAYGLLLAIANALSHDIYYKMIDPNASTTRRLVVARILLIIVALLGAYTAITLPQGILIFVSWAFSVAASGFFPALVLGVFWKRCTAAGAIAGMIAGFAICVYYMFGTEYYGVPLWFKGTFLTERGLSNIASGIIGIPVAFVVTIVVSLLTPAPSREIQEFVDQVRIPKGGALMAEAKKAE